MKRMRNNAIIIGLIIIFLIFGYMIFLYGVRNGQMISSHLTRPAGATSWTTSIEQRNLIMYGICAIGGLWIIVSHILFVVFIVKRFISVDYSKN